MKFPNLIKSLMATTVCLLPLQGRTLEGQAIGGNAPMSLSSPLQTLSVMTATARQPWTKSPFLQLENSEALGELYKRTIEQFKSPNRVQKGGGDLGGGHVLVCKVGPYAYSLKLLDLHEAENNGLDLDFGSGRTFTEKLDYVFDRLGKVSPGRAFVYRAMARNMLTKETEWLSNTEMPVIDDVKVSPIPKNCILVLAAYQKTAHEAPPKTKTYFVDRDIFALLSEDSKAALILHEILYREARYSYTKDSDFARAMVGLFSGPSILTYDKQTFNALYDDNIKWSYNRLWPCTESVHFPIMWARKYVESGCDYTQQANTKIIATVKHGDYQAELNGEFTTETVGWSDSIAYVDGKFIQALGSLTISSPLAVLKIDARDENVYRNFDPYLPLLQVLNLAPDSDIPQVEGPGYTNTVYTDYYGHIDIQFGNEVWMDPDSSLCKTKSEKKCTLRRVFINHTVSNGITRIQGSETIQASYEAVVKEPNVSWPMKKGTHFKVDIDRSEFEEGYCTGDCTTQREIQCENYFRTPGAHAVDVIGIVTADDKLAYVTKTIDPTYKSDTGFSCETWRKSLKHLKNKN